jgi:hypothetical protein
VRRVDSDISIAYKERKNAFAGAVSSGNNRCKAARRVTVKRVKRGKDATVGKDRTNRRGKYRVGERNPDGRYYAKVARKSFAGRNNTTIVCKGARSRTIRA